MKRTEKLKSKHNIDDYEFTTDDSFFETPDKEIEDSENI